MQWGPDNDDTWKIVLADHYQVRSMSSGHEKTTMLSLLHLALGASSYHVFSIVKTKWGGYVTQSETDPIYVSLYPFSSSSLACILSNIAASFTSNIYLST